MSIDSFLRSHHPVEPARGGQETGSKLLEHYEETGFGLLSASGGFAGMTEKGILQLFANPSTFNLLQGGVLWSIP